MTRTPQTPTSPGIDPEPPAETPPARAEPVSFALAMRPASLAPRLFGPELQELTGHRTRQLGGVLAEYGSPSARRTLAGTEVLITGWGAPALTEQDLAAAPRLRYLLHTGGSAASLLPPGARLRGIQAANAGLANAVPVAEYTIAMIVLANKAAFRSRNLYRLRRTRIDREEEYPLAGNIGRTVGVVGASRIGRAVIERLAAFDLDIALYDPYLTPDQAAALGARLLPLDELMRVSDVITLHPPLNGETTGMIGRAQLARIRDGAMLINTSRGAVVDQDALVDELRSGRFDAVIDVTHPDVLDPDHVLYDLPNVFLTPHIAGSMGLELRRMGRQIGAELAHIVRGEPLAHPEEL